MRKHETDLCVGDRVTLINSYIIDANRDLRNGCTGTVTKIDTEARNNVGVEWDDRVLGGHSCRKTCREGHGWFVPSESVELAVCEAAFEAPTTDELFAMLGI